MMKHKDVEAQKVYELLYYYITRTLLRHASTFEKNDFHWNVYFRYFIF